MVRCSSNNKKKLIGHVITFSSGFLISYLIFNNFTENKNEEVKTKEIIVLNIDEFIDKEEYKILHVSSQNSNLLLKNETLIERKSEKIASILNVDQKIVKDAYKVALEENIDPLLFIALIKTESEFKTNATSPKNYHGLAQIPWKVPWYDVNLRIGAKIFKEKLKIANNDVKTALRLYKGYKNDDERSRQQVKKVLTIYWKLKRGVAEQWQGQS